MITLRTCNLHLQLRARLCSVVSLLAALLHQPHHGLAQAGGGVDRSLVVHTLSADHALDADEAGVLAAPQHSSFARVATGRDASDPSGWRIVCLGI
jgi:hypothetical protein